jgi:hypothetical protein
VIARKSVFRLAVDISWLARSPSQNCNPRHVSFVSTYMGNFAADVRYAFRMMRANPAFTAVAITVLALGIAANTAIFTVIDSVLLQPLPYPEPERLMQLGRLYPNNNYGFSNSIPKYMVWRQNQVFDSIALFGQSGPGMNLGTGDRPEQIPARFRRLL